ncbi:MAG TPA: glycosyltransferase family 4 protein [Candidatus Limnocylindrales bacterium]|nr:glycosyltransferase family 4 protein [Candidatus Limnocylindrales bacterium]
MRLLLEESSERLYSDFGVKLAFAGRVDKIPLCVDTSLFRPRPRGEARTKLGIPLGAFVLLHFGFISSTKADFLTLIRVLRTLVANNPHTPILLIIGGTGIGTYSQSLLQVLREVRLQEHVMFAHAMPDHLKMDLMNASDVFVTIGDSLAESFGLAPVEAMASGLPQIATDWNGHRETVEHGKTGFLIPTKWCGYDHDLSCSDDLLGWHYDHALMSQSVIIDVCTLVDRIQALIDNSTLRAVMGEASRNRAVAEFGYEVTAQRHEELWRELRVLSKSITYISPAYKLHAPHYDAIFGGYSTERLNSHDRLTLGQQGLDMSLILRTIVADIPGAELFDLNVLEHIMSCVRELLRTDKPFVGIRISELTDLVCDAGYTQLLASRHVAWLLKHGYLGYQQ